MNGGTGEVRNIRFDGYLGPRLPREVQLKRVHKVIEEELSDRQREVMIAYYFQEMSIPAIAREWGINKSTVSRTLKRAEKRLRMFLKY